MTEDSAGSGVGTRQRAEEWLRLGDDLKDTGGEIGEEVIEAPGGQRGFYQKKGGAFSFWPIGRGQDAKELKEVLLELREEEKKSYADRDRERVDQLNVRISELGMPKEE